MSEDQGSYDAYPAEVSADALRNIFCKITDVNFDLRVKNPRTPLFPILILGEKGVGKTELIGTFAQQLAESRQEKVNTYYLYLSTQDQADLLGMPYEKDDKTYYARPEWFPDPDSDECHIIVCDEFNRAAPYVQQTMLPFSVGGQLHTHFLPPKSMVVFLCNPASEDYHVSHFNDAAFYDRMARFSVAPTMNEWLRHAEKNGVSPVIIQAAEKSGDAMIKQTFVKEEDSISVEPSNRTFSKLGMLWNEIDDKWLDHWGLVLAQAYVGREHAVPIMKQHKELLDNVLSPEQILKHVDKHIPWLKAQSKEGNYEAGKFSEMNVRLKRHVAKNFEEVTGKISKDATQLKNLATYFEYLGDDQLYNFSSEVNLEFDELKISDEDRGEFYAQLNNITKGTFTERIYGRQRVIAEASNDPNVEVTYT